MADTAYTYAVARIRSKEVSLLSNTDIQQLLGCKDYNACISFLQEKGWGNGDIGETGDSILSYEIEKTWQEMKGLVQDESIFDVLTLPDEYHNLKAAIKKVCTSDKAEGVYFKNTKVTPEELKGMIEKRDFDKLPDGMEAVAQEAMEALLQTQDGQLCDIIIDKAALEAIEKIGLKSHSSFISDYAANTVAVANIRISVRAAKTRKSREFMERSMADSSRINKDALIEAALVGVESVCTYLRDMGMEEAALAIAESPSAFERWCDNRIMDTIMSQKYNSFSEGPILAFILARENEIKTVRVILTGKSNNLDEDFIRERVRKMYV